MCALRLAVVFVLVHLVVSWRLVLHVVCLGCLPRLGQQLGWVRMLRLPTAVCSVILPRVALAVLSLLRLQPPLHLLSL